MTKENQIITLAAGIRLQIIHVLGLPTSCIHGQLHKTGTKANQACFTPAFRNIKNNPMRVAR